LALSDDGSELIHTYHPQQGGNGLPGLMQALNDAGVAYVDLYTQQSSLEGNLRQSGGTMIPVMNTHAVRAIYRFEMARTARTILQSIVSPVLSTSLYFVVFGGAIGSRITSVEGIDYGSFIVPGL